MTDGLSAVTPADDGINSTGSDTLYKHNNFISLSACSRMRRTSGAQAAMRDKLAKKL